jgi:hypothetical protein
MFAHRAANFDPGRVGRCVRYRRSRYCPRVNLGNMLQERIPRELQGRVSSVDYLGSSLLAPVGYAVGGWATELLGPVLIFIVGGILQTGLIGLGLLHPKVRTLD